jgi:hypothetical protein
MQRVQPTILTGQENAMTFKPGTFCPVRNPEVEGPYSRSVDPFIKGSQTIITKSVTPVQHISTPMKSVPFSSIPTNPATHQPIKDVIISQPMGGAVGGFSTSQVNKSRWYFNVATRVTNNTVGVG